jgi:hypothetical protein
MKLPQSTCLVRPAESPSNTARQCGVVRRVSSIASHTPSLALGLAIPRTLLVIADEVIE